MTNYEWITKMGEKELANFLCDQIDSCDECLRNNECNWQCRGQGYYEWLKREH